MQFKSRLLDSCQKWLKDTLSPIVYRADVNFIQYKVLYTLFKIPSWPVIYRECYPGGLYSIMVRCSRIN